MIPAPSATHPRSHVSALESEPTARAALQAALPAFEHHVPFARGGTLSSNRRPRRTGPGAEAAKRTRAGTNPENRCRCKPRRGDPTCHVQTSPRFSAPSKRRSPSSRSTRSDARRARPSACASSRPSGSCGRCSLRWPSEPRKPSRTSAVSSTFETAQRPPTRRSTCASPDRRSRSSCVPWRTA